MIEVLKALKNEFKALDIPYSYDDWETDVVLPYFVGDLSEVTTNNEDGKREFSFTLTGEDMDSYTNLYRVVEILKNTYKRSKKIKLDDGLMVMIYNRTFNVPVEAERVKRTQTEITIYLWESEN